MNQLTEVSKKLLQKFFIQKNILSLNSDIQKILEGRDLNVSDKTFEEIVQLNKILLSCLLIKTTSYIGVSKEVYENTKNRIGETVTFSHFLFSYKEIQPLWNYVFKIEAVSAVEHTVVRLMNGEIVDYLFPQETAFKIEMCDNIILLKEI